MSVIVLMAFVLCVFAHLADAQSLVLNEIEADSPDSNAQQECQFVELRGTPGSTVPANTYFVVVDGASGSFGDVSFPVSLGGRTVGSNGTITIINDQLNGACPGRTLPAATTTVSVFDFDGLGLLDGGARSYLLITKPTAPAAGDDIDVNNDRIIDPATGIVVVDGISITTNNTFQAGYAPIVFEALSQGAPGSILLPDAATRFSNNTTPLSASAWYYGELASSPANSTVYSGTPQSVNFPSGGELTPGGANLPTLAAPGKAVVDFNGDGRTDFSITRTSGGSMNWISNINGTSENRFLQFGSMGDVPLAEDFDGDGKDDYAVWRTGPAFSAGFYIFQSSTNTARFEIFGQAGDNPRMAGDWDGDGKADPAVFRDGAQAFFYYRGSLNNPSGNITFVPWGTTGDKPQRGDFDGDGKQDAAVFRPSNAVWYIVQSSNSQFTYTNWGLATDRFVPADYDGDSKTDLAVVRGSEWYVLQSSTSSPVVLTWGLPGDTLVPGDYNGDGKTDAAVWRGGVFYVAPFGGGSPIYQNFGVAGDFPVANSFAE